MILRVSWTVIDNDIPSMELAVVLQMTFPGRALHFYYGDEVGMRGGMDPENRYGFHPRD